MVLQRWQGWIHLFVLLPMYSMASLKQSLLDINYDMRRRPYYGEKPVNVSVQIYIYSIGPINEQDFTFTLGFYLRQWWTDQRLTHLNLTKDITFGEVFTDIIWIPDTAPRDTYTLKLYRGGERTVIYPSGRVYINQRMKMTCKCEMELRHYPMDIQQCHFYLESFAFGSTEITYSWTMFPIVQSEYLQVEGYTLEKITPYNKKQDYLIGNKTVSWSYLQATVTVKRTLLYFIFRAYIPSILLITIVCGTFWVPDNAVPARVTMIITSFLTNMFMLQSISESIVKVRYVTAMQAFLLVNTTVIALSMVEFLIVLALKKQRQLKLKEMENEKNDVNNKKKTQQNNQQLNSSNKNAYVLNMAYFSKLHKRFSFNKNKNLQTRNDEINKPTDTRRETKALENHTHFLDRMSRVVCPITYALFCIAYFTYYITDAGSLESP